MKKEYIREHCSQGGFLCIGSVDLLLLWQDYKYTTCHLLLLYKVPLESNLASKNVLIISLLGITPRKILTQVPKKTFIKMLIKTLILKQKVRNSPSIPVTEE